MKLRLPDRRHVYVFNVRPKNRAIPFMWIGKVGFAQDEARRAADVERSIWQVVGVEVEVSIFCRTPLPVFMYRGIEGAIHNVIKPLHSKRFLGASGGTEFFRVINWLTALIVYCVLWGFGVANAWMFAIPVMALPWPLDFSIFVLILAGFEYLLYAGAIWVAWLAGAVLIGL